jgi:DNA repair exonuclease SbcCD nuclease subunit
MKRLFTADIHFSGYGQDRLDDETGLPERLASIKRSLYYMAEYCSMNGITKFEFGGDLMHNKSVVYSVAQKIIKQFLFDYRNTMQFTFLTGNHDLSGKGSDAISSLEFLDLVENENWVYLNACYQDMFTDNTYYVPYSYDMVDKIKKNKYDAEILVSHFGLSEGVLNSGISIVSKLNANDLVKAGYKLVLLGHYHKPQELINDQISIYYVGSPIQLDWGEKGDEKRFLIYDNETLEVESVPIEGYKKHIELDVTNENKDEVLKIAREAKEQGHHVKLLKKDQVDDSKFSGEFFVVDKTEKDITNRGITLGMAQEERFKKYLEIEGIPEEEHEEYLNESKMIIGDEHEESSV